MKCSTITSWATKNFAANREAFSVAIRNRYGNSRQVIERCDIEAQLVDLDSLHNADHFFV